MSEKKNRGQYLKEAIDELNAAESPLARAAFVISELREARDRSPSPALLREVVEAMTFYANAESYEHRPFYEEGLGHSITPAAVSFDKGVRARTMLFKLAPYVEGREG